MKTRDEIIGVMELVAREGNKTLVPDFSDATVLLQSGLDSLDFAIVVARLEEKLDADPFSQMAEPVYPRTLGDFVAIYERYLADRER